MKKSKKTAKRVLSFALTVTLFAGCAILLSGCKKKKTVATDPADILKEAAVETADLSGMDFTFSSRDKDGSYDEKTATRVVFSEKAVAVNGAGAGAEGTALTIDAAGTYLLCGACTAGSVTVSAADTDKIQLVLCGLTLRNPNGPALVCRQRRQSISHAGRRIGQRSLGRCGLSRTFGRRREPAGRGRFLPL